MSQQPSSTLPVLNVTANQTLGSVISGPETRPAHLFMTSARGQIRGARVLAASGNSECSSAFALVVGFVLELTLKGFVETHEPGAKDNYGHHIDKLWESAVKFGLPNASMPMPPWVEAIHRSHSPPYLARYLDGNSSVMVMPEEKQTMTEMDKLFATVELETGIN